MPCFRGAAVEGDAQSRFALFRSSLERHLCGSWTAVVFPEAQPPSLLRRQQTRQQGERTGMREWVAKPLRGQRPRRPCRALGRCLRVGARAEGRPWVCLVAIASMAIGGPLVRPVHASASSAYSVRADRGFYRLTCPDVSACVAINNEDNRVYSFDPQRSDEVSPVLTVVTPDTEGGFFGTRPVACPSITQCTLVGGASPAAAT